MKKIKDENNRTKSKLLFSLITGFVICIIGIAIGSVMVPIDEILNIISNKIFGMKLQKNIDLITAAIVWNIRIPRVIMAFVVGFSISISGAIMQSTLKNPLASSYTLGISSGAGLGVMIVIVTGLTIPFLGLFTLPIVGLISGFATVFLAIGFASRIDKNMENNTIILTGMIFSLFANALLTIFLSFAKDDALNLIMWQLGSFSQKDWSYVGILTPISIILTLITMLYTKELDILTFGEEHAKASGVDTVKVKWILLVLSSALAGCSVSLVGTVGFIDLVAPHVVRKIFGANHRIVIPLSGLFGGGFMVIADLLARTIISPSEIPVGAVTALIGAPFFGYLFFLRRNS